MPAPAILHSPTYAPFNWGKLGRLEVLYQAGLLVGADASSVESWPDRAGRGRTAESVIGADPTLETLESVFNYRQVVRLTGANAFQTASFGATLAQPLTHILIAKATTANAAQRMFVDGADGSNRCVVYCRDLGPPDQWGIYAGSTEISGGSVDTNPHIFIAEFNGASSSLLLDGVSVASGNPGSQGVVGVTIGTAYDFNAANDCDVAELAIYSGLLAPGAKNLALQYAHNTYGLAVTYL